MNDFVVVKWNKKLCYYKEKLVGSTKLLIS